MSTATRGFASMPKELRRAVARRGALAAHASGHAYEWTSETAREAGRRGGVASGFSKRGGRPKVTRPRVAAVPVPAAPAPAPVVVSRPDPMALLQQHLKKVVTDALVRSRDLGTADEK